MLFIAGVNPKLKEQGIANAQCLACAQADQLHIVKEVKTVNLFFIPVASLGEKYYATCPSCASVMELGREAGKKLARYPQAQILRGELRMIKNNSAAKCNSCGRRVYDDHLFCPGCGIEL